MPRVIYDELYIVGNGFDLYHGLKSSYFDFADYLKKRDSSIYDLLESYIGSPVSHVSLWKDFEENLANLDTSGILEDNEEYLPNLASDEFRDRHLHAFPDTMDDIFKKLTKELSQIFRDFICEIKIPNTAGSKIITINKEAIFLSFNYTDTLETLYNIAPENILYIHNKASGKDENIFLGHGTDPQKFKEPEPVPPEHLSEEDLEKWREQQDNWDYSYDTGKENLLKYFSHSYKPTQEIIRSHKSFFSGLHTIENIFVLGHSLSNVDIAYFTEIQASVKPNAKWLVSYYYEDEIESHLKMLTEVGVKRDNIQFIVIEDLQI